MDGIETLKRIRSQNSASALRDHGTAKSKAPIFRLHFELAQTTMSRSRGFPVALARVIPDQPQAGRTVALRTRTAQVNEDLERPL